MTVHYTQQGAVAVLEADNPPVNALGQGVREGLEAALRRALADDGVRAVVIACRGRTFFAGADIREFGAPAKGPLLAALIALIEESDKPMVAAVHGTAFGGGLEVALGCHFRVATPDAKLGLPEVKLGLLPGAGGTQRLPRLVGAERALSMIASGEPVDAREAQRVGLVDALAEGPLVEFAVAFADRALAEGRPLRRARDLVCEAPAALWEQQRAYWAKKKRGYEAPQRCVDAVQAACELPFEQGLARERALFERCLASPQSAAQRHVFFAERLASKVPGVDRGVAPRQVARVGVLGAGTMGGGITMALANAGLPVVLLDAEAEALERGLSRLRANYESSVKRGRLSETERDARLARIQPTTELAALAEVDLVIEAVYEDMALKRRIFGELDQVCRRGAILATNTSTLDVNEIARSTSRPQDVVGLHFFSPANVMRLVEIVRGAETGADVIQTSLALAKRLGKVGVVVGVCHGFVGNRMLYPYRREASFLVEEGATPEQVDGVLEGLGLPMGPFAMADLAGLDVGWRVRQAQGKPAGERYSGTLADRLCEQGRFGQKTGAGFYRYPEGSRARQPDPEVLALARQVAREQGVAQREVSDEEIRERCLFALINEGARILDEGIALRASDIDTVWVYGYGFPAFLGGPMYHADQLGLAHVYARVQHYAEREPKLWAPAEGLARLAAEGGTFTGAAAG